eukprot:12422974-Karenia_brevis.AAC.1
MHNPTLRQHRRSPTVSACTSPQVQRSTWRCLAYPKGRQHLPDRCQADTERDTAHCMHTATGNCVYHFSPA